MKMVNLCRNICNIVGLSILGVLAIILLFWGSLWFRIYLERYVEKNPEVILAAVEKEYQIVFPGNMNEVHAARTIAMEGAHSVIIKFTAECAIVETFIMSLGAEDPNQFTPYTPEEEYRKTGLWPMPGWFLEPIDVGTGDIDNHVFYALGIDTSDELNYKVYIRTSYKK